MNDVFRALADPTRREIVRLLRNGPRTSGEIAERFPSTWATISRHLSVLRDAGLILAERDGQRIRYELNTTVFQDLVDHLMDWIKPGGRRA
ncbi:MAG: winged helix-turn-helix transcriptional regulator [Gemmatimonadaceae bacterium]|nr:winged helix-turn-helix transcriptional regulator [Gemmatimonadaceae bacterium]